MGPKRGAGEALPSQFESRRRRLPLRTLAGLPSGFFTSPLHWCPARRVHRSPRPRIPAPAPPPGRPVQSRLQTRQLRPWRGLASRDDRARASLSFAFAPPSRSRVSSGPSYRARVRPAGKQPAPALRPFATAVVTGPGGRPASSPRCRERTGAMFGAGDEDDTDFLSPSGG